MSSIESNRGLSKTLANSDAHCRANMLLGFTKPSASLQVSAAISLRFHFLIGT
jgi:myo-inositol catabolism protein IolC